MATSRLKGDNRPRAVPASVKAKTLVRWGSLLKLLHEIYGADFKLSLDGFDPMEFAGGLHLKNAGAGGSGGPCPWDGEVTTDGDGDTIFQFTMTGVLRPAGLPTNMFAEDGTLFSCACEDNPTYVILSCTTDGSVVTSTTIIARGTPANPIGIEINVAPASFELDLYVVANGIALKAIECANPQAKTYVALQTDKADPICAGVPYDNHYSWEITETDDGS